VQFIDPKAVLDGAAKWDRLYEDIILKKR
jgi:hypothetical protein